jgi:hypothetical protein
VVTRVDGDPGHGYRITLNDGSGEDLAPASLAFGDGDVLYCDVKSGTYRARFLRAAQSELLGHVTSDGERFVLPVPGGVQPLERPA